MRKLIQAAILLAASAAFAADQPPIPRLATWESNMTTYGSVTCNKFVAQGVLFGTYYDGLRSMESIRAYRAAAGAPAAELASWNACSDIANDVYRDNYVLRADVHGSVPGYNEFTGGFVMHFNRTAETESSKAIAYIAGYHLIDLIGSGAAYCSYTQYDNAGVTLQRETAYCMLSTLNHAVLGGNPQTLIPQTGKNKREGLLATMYTQAAKRIGTRVNPAPTILPIPSPEIAEGHCPTGTPAGANQYVQPFMLAIQAHAFIQYYEQVGLDQAKILEQVKWIADWLRTEAYLPAYKAFWYENCRIYSPSGGGWGSKPGAVDLSLMFVDIYEWLYRKTCDTSYRDFADTMFDEAVRLGSTFLGTDGKHFNQNYAAGSFEYVAMRKLDSPTCGVTLPGVPGQPTITVGVNP